MWVRCHCQPARWVLLKPCAIHARHPYPQAVLASGGRAVSINHGSLSPASQQANSVQWSWRCRPLKAIPVPCHVVPGSGPNVFRGTPRTWPVGRQVPPVLMRKNGCQPSRVMRRNSQRASPPPDPPAPGPSRPVGPPGVPGAACATTPGATHVWPSPPARSRRPGEHHPARPR
jgi:hypothetical protein